MEASALLRSDLQHIRVWSSAAFMCSPALTLGVKERIWKSRQAERKLLLTSGVDERL